MAIVYYPNRVYKGKVPVIDRLMAIRKPVSVVGSANIASNSLSVVISNDENWQLDSIGWQFSNVASRNFNAFIMSGRKVVENINDRLWLQINGTFPQFIILSPGFYTGTQLATQLQTRLNAATLLDGSTNAFNTAGVTFTVTYNTIAGTYTITPASGTVRYLDVNTSQVLPIRDSIAGHLFGLTTTTVFAASITSDTTVFGLDSEVAFVSQSASSDLTYYHNDVNTMTVDQALHLTSNSGADVTMTYVVDYETLV